MKYQAIIFDLDGTIIDTEHIWLEANKQVLIRRGIQPDNNFLEKLFTQIQGAGLAHSCTVLKEMCKLEDSLEDLIQEKESIAHGLYEQGVRLIEGFVDFHAKAQKLNLKMGIATNANTQTVAATNKKLNLEQFFGPHIYSISHVNNQYKPNPAVYLYAAQNLNIEPKACIAIEDSAHGIKAAKNAGMLCIGINTAKKPEQLIQADLIINSYEELELDTLLI